MPLASRPKVVARILVAFSATLFSALGLWLAIAASLGILTEYSHFWGHSKRELCWLSAVFDDFTWAPVLTPTAILFILFVVVFLEKLLFKVPTCLTLSRLVPKVLALYSALYLGFLYYLGIEDISSIQWHLRGHNLSNPYHALLFSLIGLQLLILLVLLFEWYRPCVGASALIIGIPCLYYMAIMYNPISASLAEYMHPLIYPSLGGFLLSTALTAACAALLLLRCKLEDTYQFKQLLSGAYGWALLPAYVSAIGFIVPFHHMCLHERSMGQQMEFYKLLGVATALTAISAFSVEWRRYQIGKQR